MSETAQAVETTLERLLPPGDGPEARIPEARVPEARVPEARIPEARIPEARVPEARVPEARVPEARVPEARVPEARVYEAMRYACLGGGKRLRPFLVVAGADMYGVPRERALRAGAAVELVHCYSLVHDDLPAMDDDALRRGRPTTHIQFDEATAVLAGDGLLTLAFEVLADPATHDDPAIRCALITALARAAGAQGMVGGQMFDLAAEDRALGLGEISRLQNLKTGQLFNYSCAAGAILGGASTKELDALTLYSQDLGLAFQIADDLLDIEGNEDEVGKKVGKDADAGKATFVSILGVDEARNKATQLVEQATSHLEFYCERADLLRDVARFVIERRT
ncbi:MAG TPA: farnesyl diphosphate synthase [Alphaproteobacteria bacterium]|nr:farnesyl diphosphate synthase [Alphaproteobacteria bacterium]